MWSKELGEKAFRFSEYSDYNPKNSKRDKSHEAEIDPKANVITRLKHFQKEPVVSSAKNHLVRAYGLGAIFKYLKNTSEFSSEGFLEAKKWKSLRGRPKALKMALKWLGFDGVEIKERGKLERWTKYQVGLPREVTEEEVRRIKGVCELSTPSRAELERIYVLGSNNQQIELSSGEGSLSDGSLLSKDRGPVDREGFTNDA